jgi:hypothetical protein
MGSRFEPKKLFFNKYQKKLFEHKNVTYKSKILENVEGDLEETDDEDIPQEKRTLKVQLNVPSNGIGGGPRFLVQFETQNHVFLDENEKVKSNLMNTLQSLLKIDHSIGRDFKYFHIESLVKAFLPLKLVSNIQVQEMNKKKIAKLKKEYNKKRAKLAPIKEEREWSNNNNTEANNHIHTQNNFTNPSHTSLNRGLQQHTGHRVRVSSMNSSLRSENMLTQSNNFDIKRKQKIYRSLKNEHLLLGYEGGNHQYVGAKFG